MAVLLVFIVIILLISINAFYVAAEFATVSARRSRVETLASDGNKLARQLLPYLADASKLDYYIAGCQVGITISSLIIGLYGQAQLAKYLGQLMSTTAAIIIVLVLLTTLQVIFGELLPKSIALRYPERLALITTLPMVWSLFILRPFINLLNGSALVILKTLGLQKTAETHAHSPEELELIFKESAQGGYLDAKEREMLENALVLQRRLARQVMIPRTKMVTLKLSTPVQEALAKCSATPYTRFPVFDQNIDHIVGMVHLKDLFLFVQDKKEGSLQDIIREIPLVPESNTVAELWNVMQQRKSYIAVLFDEYGGTVGMVSVEDIVEEIVGELQDEFDSELQPFKRDAEGRVVVRGDVLIEAVNKKFLVNFSNAEADTIGGLMLELFERIPSVAEERKLDGIILRVDSVEHNAVTQVSFKLPSRKREVIT